MMHWYVLGIITSMGTFTDLSKHKLPNWLTGGGTVLGLAVHAGQSGWSGFLHAAEGAAAGFGILFILYALRAVGAGDVKFFAAVGACSGLDCVLSMITYSICYAGLLGLAYLAVKRGLKSRLPLIGTALAGLFLFKDREAIGSVMNRSDLIRFPFMLAVVPALITVLYERLGL